MKAVLDTVQKQAMSQSKEEKHMKKNRRNLCLSMAMIVALLSVTALGGCGGGNSGSGTTAASTAAAAEAETQAAGAAKETSAAEETSAESESTAELGGSLTVATDMKDTGLEKFQGLLDSFTEETGVKIDVIAPGTDYESQMKTMMASNSMPDVFATHGWSRDRYGEYLMKVNDQPWFDRMDTVRLSGAMEDEDGNFYALDFDLGNTGMNYNADVLEEAGVDLSELATWDGFAGACEKIKAIGKVPIIVGGASIGEVADLLETLAPTFWTDEGAGVDGAAALMDGSFDFDTYGTELYRYFADNFIKKGYLNEDALTMDTALSRQAFARGDAAFLFATVGTIRTAKEYNPDANFGFLPAPVSREEAKRSWTIGEGVAYGVWKDTENPNAAWAFLDYLARPENALIMVNLGTGLPALEGVGANENDEAYKALQAGLEYIGDDCNFENYFDRTYFPSGMWGVMGQSVATLIDNPDDVDGAVAILRDNYQTLYSEEHQE